MPKRRESRKIYFETVLTRNTNDVIVSYELDLLVPIDKKLMFQVECVFDCGEHSDDDFFAQMHKEFVEAIEKNFKCTGSKKKNKKKWEAEKILGSVMSDGELMFMIKWKAKDDVTLISAQQATQKYPELVKFYFKRRLQWSPVHDKQTYKMIERPKI